MPIIRGIFVSLCMLLVLAIGASAAPTSKPAKPSASGGSNATIYIMRSTPVLGWATQPDIRVDGKFVGELSVGSYLVVNAPRGQHKLEVQGGAPLTGPYESGIQVEAGKSYFIEVGPRPNNGAPGTQLMTRFFANTMSGQELPGRGFFGTYVFYLLDAGEGRAKIATLKKIAR